VEAICINITGDSAGASDTGYNSQLLRLKANVSCGSLNGSLDGEVSAPRAPVRLNVVAEIF
jgi:hypothetical protein